MSANMSESQLWASLHERLAGTPGVHELAELQRRVTPLFSLADPADAVEYAGDQDGDLIPFVNEHAPMSDVEDHRGIEL